MSSVELSFMWDDHHNTLVKVFGKLLETSSLVDCTIAAEGQYIKAHKIILSACSPYFELLFNQENEKNPIVVLKDVKFRELKAIIDFIYCGKVRVPEDHLGDFVDAAESLQIKGLWSDNYKAPNSGWISEGSKSPHSPEHEFSDSSSPVHRKRRRASSINEDNVSELSSGTNVNDEYRSIVCVSQGQMQEDRFSHHIGQHSSSATPPPLEMLPNPDTMVIKTEPELLAEVCLPEMDFELKCEEDVEDTIVLASDGEVPGAVLNEDTAFPTALQTAAASSNNAFLKTDVVKHTSTQVADTLGANDLCSSNTNCPSVALGFYRDVKTRWKKSNRTDLSNPAYRKPFEMGWKRELVFRKMPDQSPKQQADVYYYTPSGKKVRSAREVSQNLSGTDLTDKNFTFFRMALGVNDATKEIIRIAKPRGSSKTSPQKIPKLSKTVETNGIPRVAVLKEESSGSPKKTKNFNRGPYLHKKKSPKTPPQKIPKLSETVETDGIPRVAVFKEESSGSPKKTKNFNRDPYLHKKIGIFHAWPRSVKNVSLSSAVQLGDPPASGREHTTLGANDGNGNEIEGGNTSGRCPCSLEEKGARLNCEEVADGINFVLKVGDRTNSRMCSECKSLHFSLNVDNKLSL